MLPWGGGGTQILLYVTDWISVYSVKAVQEHFYIRISKISTFFVFKRLPNTLVYEDNTHICRKETYQTFQKNDI